MRNQFHSVIVEFPFSITPQELQKASCKLQTSASWVNWAALLLTQPSVELPNHPSFKCKSDWLLVSPKGTAENWVCLCILKIGNWCIFSFIQKKKRWALKNTYIYFHMYWCLVISCVFLKNFLHVNHYISYFFQLCRNSKISQNTWRCLKEREQDLLVLSMETLPLQSLGSRTVIF